MKLITLLITAGALCLQILSILNAEACSRVVWQYGDGVVAARTMDWSHSFEDFLFVYPRGQETESSTQS